MLQGNSIEISATLQGFSFSFGDVPGGLIPLCFRCDPEVSMSFKERSRGFYLVSEVFQKGQNLEHHIAFRRVFNKLSGCSKYCSVVFQEFSRGFIQGNSRDFRGVPRAFQEI